MIGAGAAVNREDVSRSGPTAWLCEELSLVDSGWAVLKVPNELVIRLFDSLDEPGIALPTNDSFNAGNLNAHVSVLDCDEVEHVGPAIVAQQVGRRFRFQIGPLKVVTPLDSARWKKVWYVTVVSPELEELRAGLGLTRRPHNDEFDFHITVAVLRAEL